MYGQRVRRGRLLQDGTGTLIVACEIKFFLKNSPKTSLTKAGPLSDTILSGRPCVANMLRSLSTVVAAFMEATGTTSNHFEWASTTIRKIFPMKGPAWSIYANATTAVTAKIMGGEALLRASLGFLGSSYTLSIRSRCRCPFLATMRTLVRNFSFVRYLGDYREARTAHVAALAWE